MTDGRKHNLFAPSSAERWIRCPGSMAFPENRKEGASSIYADEGTAAHELASRCLKDQNDAYEYIGEIIEVGENKFTVDEEFAGYVQVYVDDIRRRAMAGQMLIEQKVEISELTDGTSDAIIACAPELDIDAEVVDLKFGQGEPVYSYSYADADAPFQFDIYVDDTDEPMPIEPNYQLMLYAIGSLAIIRMLLEKVHRIRLVINQPRIGILSELVVTVEILERFELFARDAKTEAQLMMDGIKPPRFSPGEKQCRWCRAPYCEARDAKVAEAVGAEFEVIEGGGATPPLDPEQLSRAFRAIPFIRDWIKATEAKANEVVANGGELIGIDGKPMKFVEGDLGDRKWSDEAKAEAALLAVLKPDEAYQPRKILTAAKINQKYNKAKTLQFFKDNFEPLIKRAPGKPMLALGSDPRPPYVGAASSDEFEEGESE